MLRPVHIDEAWPKIRHIAEELIQGDVTAENLRLECQENRAMCLQSDDGIIIVTLIPCRFTNTFSLFVWLSVALGEHGAFERQEPNVDELAKTLGAVRIAFNSKRRGWARKLGDGWEEKFTRYEKELKC